MKIYFEFNRKEFEQNELALLDELARVVPDAAIDIDRAASRLTVTLPEGADPVAAAESIRLAALPLGVSLKLVVKAEQSVPPPITFFNPVKRKRGVPVPAFVLSLIAVALIFSILASVFTAVFVLGSNSTIGAPGQESEDYVGKIALVDAIFTEYSIYDTDGNLLLDQMLLAYALATGDRYAYYYNAEQFAAVMAETNAEAVGIGVSVVEDVEAKGILIVQVYEGSPAAEAGLLPGDVIVAFYEGENRIAVADIGFELALERFAGPAGSVASFSVLRDGRSLDFTATRAKLTVQSVQGRVSATDPKVGILRITGFDLQTPVQFKAEMNALIQAGCERFVFDVRNNPGGDLRSINAVLACFLNKGDAIVSMHQKDGTSSLYTATPVTYTGDAAGCSIKEEEIGVYRQYPMAVITNAYTASAAELFTSVLQEYKLATVVGQTTYGKGVYQNIIDLAPYGYTGGLRLTVGYYSPPSGNNYDGKGIVPNLPIEQPAGKHLYLLEESEDAQLQAALQSFNQNSEN